MEDEREPEKMGFAGGNAANSVVVGGLNFAAAPAPNSSAAGGDSSSSESFVGNNNNNNNITLNPSSIATSLTATTTRTTAATVTNHHHHHQSSSSSSSQSEKLFKPTRACPSPISSIVGTALNQMNLKRSSSAPMINQLGTQAEPRAASMSSSSIRAGTSSQSGNESKETASRSADIESSTGVNGFLSSLSGPRPRRFSASFSPGSPGLAPNRVSQLRQESSNCIDWESASEKEFHGNANIAQSWEDLSLDSMSMEVTTRRPSLSDQLWLSMPGSTSLSASSSPNASPRVVSRFSPSLSSPSPTRKNFTSRRSLSPIAIRPSVLTVGQGVKRKCDWDSNQMDCSPQPAKRAGGLLSLQQYNQCVSPTVTSSSVAISVTSTMSPGIMINNSHNISSHDLLLRHSDSPNSIETESSISSSGDSPFFRPLDSPLTSDESTHPK